MGLGSSQHLRRKSLSEKFCFRSGCTSLSLEEMAETVRERDREMLGYRLCCYPGADCLQAPHPCKPKDVS